MKELLDRSLAQTIDLLDRGEVCSVDLVLASIARAEQIHPHLNAFLRIDAEAAIESARKLDAERAQGRKRGALHGVPMAHKDMFYRAGIASSCGARVRLPLPTTTSTALARLDAAGAVQFGVLNMAEFALGPTGHNLSFGHCRNPWNTARITGGSSSGSAAAVAARCSFASLGSDTGASIRLPASINGITGLKTTSGRVSRAGAMGLSATLDTIGPLARSAYDCALMMNVIAGPDALDPSTAGREPADHLEQIDAPVSGLRIGVPQAGYFTRGLDAGMAQLMQDSLAVLRDLGCVLVPVDPGDIDAVNAAAGIVMAAEAAALHANLLREQGERYSPQVRIRAERGFAISAPQYLDALRYRGMALEQFCAAVFSRVDVLHIPVLPIATPTIAASEIQGGPALDALLGDLTRFLRPFNYLGLPALALPAGFLADGMPAGMQLVGRPFSEDLLLRLGHAYQRVTDWHERAPRV